MVSAWKAIEFNKQRLQRAKEKMLTVGLTTIPCQAIECLSSTGMLSVYDILTISQIGSMPLGSLATCALVLLQSVRMK